ncbi:MAG: SagB/ThcOx family dehydrogenase [Chloroflexota bacterium]|nr:MAG: SagB/ThcOx family dehydrogenase [Chloroflexota bacterium]
MIKKWVLIIFFCLLFVLLGGVLFNYFRRDKATTGKSGDQRISLPKPVLSSRISIEQALAQRRSIREYSSEPLTLEEISQLLWAAQGINRPGGYRTAPSAGALYPLEVYLVSNQIDQVPAGFYHYNPEGHAIEQLLRGDFRYELSQAGLNQQAIQNAPAVFLITAIYERTTAKYGPRGRQYVHMEVGSAAQNVYLQAYSLDIGTVFIGAFHDDQVKRLFNLASEEQPLCLLPLGKLN